MCYRVWYSNNRGVVANEMITADELKQKYILDKRKEIEKMFISLIEDEIKATPFIKSCCEVEVSWDIDKMSQCNIINHFQNLGYDCGIYSSKNKAKAVVGWNTSTKYDRYYITNSTHPSGSFMVRRVEEDEFSHGELRQMQYWGNYFETKEEAEEVAKELNKILRKRVGLISEE